MIRVYFTDGSEKSFQVGCRMLFCSNWDSVDYKSAFEPIAHIIGVKAEAIERWRVI